MNATRTAANGACHPKVKAKADTVLKSYALIERAGGAQVTLSSYRREASEIYQRRKRRRRKKILR